MITESGNLGTAIDAVVAAICGNTMATITANLMRQCFPDQNQYDSNDTRRNGLDAGKDEKAFGSEKWRSRTRMECESQDLSETAVSNNGAKYGSPIAANAQVGQTSHKKWNRNEQKAQQHWEAWHTHVQVTARNKRQNARARIEEARASHQLSTGDARSMV